LDYAPSRALVTGVGDEADEDDVAGAAAVFAHRDKFSRSHRDDQLKAVQAASVRRRRTD
jgi:hypothetical protein